MNGEIQVFYDALDHLLLSMHCVISVVSFLQGCCVNAPMITVADYSNGSEGYTYNYYVGQL
jgi:hypothetical protein